MAREATIQQIDTISPIPKADFLELATLKGMGWTFVVKKGAFKPSDLCIFFAIDSELPRKAPWAAFLADKGSTRIKTRRFRGAISQGLALETNILIGNKWPTGMKDHMITQVKNTPTGIEITGMYGGISFKVRPGTDVTHILGVTHYEKPIPEGMNGTLKGAFPRHIPKTDETMLQNIPSILQEMEGQEIYITVKCDGTSSTFSRVEGELEICSQNWSLKEWSREEDPDGKPPIHNLYWKMFRKYEMDTILNENDNIAIQAEMVGPGIQKNKLDLNEVEIRVFDIWDVKKSQYYDFDDLWDFCLKYKLPMVPVLYTSNGSGGATTSLTLTGAMRTMEYWLERAQGTYQNTKNRREGIVVRTCKAQYMGKIGIQNRASFKALNNNFLLKDED